MGRHDHSPTGTKKFRRRPGGKPSATLEPTAGPSDLWGAATEARRAQSNPHGLPELSLLTVREATAVLGVSRSFLYELIGRGELESFKIGRARRVSRASLVRLLDRCRKEPGDA